jgi:hypothetical protein
MQNAANDNRLGLRFSAAKASATEAVTKAEDYLAWVRQLQQAEDTERTRRLLEGAITTLENAQTALASLLAAEQIVLSAAPHVVY